MQVKWFAAGIAFAAVSAGAPAPAAADTRVGVGVYVGDHPRPRLPQARTCGWQGWHSDQSRSQNRGADHSGRLCRD